MKTAASTPKNRVWNFFGSPLGQIRSESDLSAETATGSVQFSYETASGQAYYYTSDHLGSKREMLNSSGTIVARYSYDPYGRTTLVSGSNLATKQYAGMLMHQTSGLYLTKGSGSQGAAGRIYDTGIGRWGSRDPIEEDGGINLYGYVLNDPVDLIDPRGLFPHGYTPYNPPDDDDPTRPFKPPIMPDVPMPPFGALFHVSQNACFLLSQLVWQLGYDSDPKPVPQASLRGLSFVRQPASKLNACETICTNQSILIFRRTLLGMQILQFLSA